MADGYIPNKTTNVVIRVKKERKKVRLRALLEAANIAYKETMPEYIGAEGFSVFKFYAPRNDKVYTSYYWNCSPQQLAVIADEVVHWDGSERKAGAHEFFAKQKESIDFIQYAFATVGRTATPHLDDREDSMCWTLHIRKELVGSLPLLDAALPTRFSITADGAAAALLAFGLDLARRSPRVAARRWAPGAVISVAILAVLPLRRRFLAP